MVIALLFVISGCGAQKDSVTGLTQTTIRVAHFGGVAQTEIFEDIIQEWDKRHPNITVKLEHVAGQFYLPKLLTGITAGTAPDVAWVENRHMPPLFGKGGLLPLNYFVERDPDVQIEDYWPEEIDRFTQDGKLYALPNDTAPVCCIYYNKKLFDQAGLPYPSDDWDWSQFLSVAKKLTRRDEQGNVVQYGFLGYAWQSFVYCPGGRIVDDVQNPVKCVLDSAEAIEGLRFFFDLHRKHNVMPSPVEAEETGMNYQQLFMNGRVAMFNSGIWNSKPFDEITDFDWDVAMFPRYPGKKHAWFTTGGSGWSILSATKHAPEAWEVVKLMGGPEVQKRLAGTGCFQPAIMALAESKNVWLRCPPKPRNKGIVNEAVEYAIYDPFTPNWSEIHSSVVWKEFDKVWVGHQSIEEAVARIVPAFDRLLAEARANRRPPPDYPRRTPASLLVPLLR